MNQYQIYVVTDNKYLSSDTETHEIQIISISQKP